MEEKLLKNEQIEDLECKGLKIIQNKALYTFTSDSVILANFLKIKSKDICVEIGSGSGVISILASAKNNFDKIYSFELQPQLAELAERNVKINNLNKKIEIINDKIQNYQKYFKKESVDVVFSNPPYMKDMKNACENNVRDIARHDKTLSMEELCKCVSGLLKFGGKFYVVYSAERSCELISCLIKHKLEPKQMFYTDNGKGRVVLVVIEAVKGGKSGVKVLPNLTTNKRDGKFLEKLQTRNFID